MVRPIVIPKLRLIDRPLFQIKRGLNANGSLQAEILIQVQEIGTETIYRINYNDHNGRQEQAYTAWIEL